MALNVSQLRNGARQFARQPRTRKVALWVVSFLLGIGLLGALAALPPVRHLLSKELSKALHREVSIQQLRINPYTLSATVRGFAMKEPQSAVTAVSFDELYVNLEMLSLFQRGTVLKEIRLVKPYINLIRNEDRTYNYQDLIDEFTSGPPGPRPRFSLNNIQVIDGRIDFDDRPEQTKHTISSLKIGVPFISSLPSYVDIKVQPVFSAIVNGSPLEIGGETTPFKDSLDSAVHLEIDKAQIPKYLEYSPVPLNFKAPSGQLDGKLSASFRRPKNKAATLVISGNLAVRELSLQEKDEAPLMNLPSLQVIIDALEVFANKASFKTVKVQGLELHLNRNRYGSLNVTNLVGAQAQATPVEPKKEQASAPFAFHVDEILLESGKLNFTDQVPDRPYRTQLENIRLNIKGLTNEADKKAMVEISFDSDAKERFNHTGAVQLTPLLVEGKIDIEALRPAAFRPYYQNTVAAEIREGFLDISTLYALEQKTDKTELKFSELNAALRTLRLEQTGQAEPLWRLPLLAIKETTVDVGSKTIVIGKLEGREGSGFVLRESDGTLNYARLVKTQAPETPSPEPPKKDDTGWKIEAKQIALDRFRVNFEDRAAAALAKLNLSELSVRGQNFSNAKNQTGKATISTRVNNKGVLKLAGTVSANPVVAKFNVEGQEVELLPFQPYLADQVNFVLTGGRVGTKGNLSFDGSGKGPAKVGYEGNVELLDFATVEKNGAQDLLKWKSLVLGGIQFALEPMQLRINEINLADFYSRLIIGPDGKINLQNLAAQKKEEAPAKTAPSDKPAEVGAPASTNERRITIGKINLQGGNVNFSDFFVKPNYSANLTGVQGAVSELKPETPGDLEIQAKLDNAAPVDIRGKINPLAENLYLDIKADATDIELSPMSPYSGKYVGYGIDKGKLSFNVSYKVENRKLEAQNKIVLNQLTFGERVESPDATKLPVLLAVALLKDRNGVIDINMPIGGSLDDPQFSVGGIVLKLILNIITRAVTAPFTLLAAAFGGGGGEELSYIEFDYGRANLTQSGETRIKTLATAMNNRPALKLEISGRVDPVNDLEGLKKTGIERKVKAQKLKELVRQGTAPKSPDEVNLDKAEYERFLKAAYADESFPKPRNIIGLARDLPVPEMEKLMLQNSKVTEDDLRELANRRAQAVKDRLLASGQVTGDRLFIVASKPAATEDKGSAKAKASRVDFALR